MSHGTLRLAMLNFTQLYLLCQDAMCAYHKWDRHWVLERHSPGLERRGTSPSFPPRGTCNLLQWKRLLLTIREVIVYLPVALCLNAHTREQVPSLLSSSL